MTYGDFKDLPRRTAPDIVLHDKAFNIAKNPKYDGYQRCFASTAYEFFNKKTTSLGDKSASSCAAKTSSEIMLNQDLAK